MYAETSLFDPGLFDDDEPEETGPPKTTGAAGPAGTDAQDAPGTAAELSLHGVVRHQLARGAWIDLLPDWVTGGDLLDRLLEDVPWRAERRPMYDRVVDVPRLLCHYGEGERLPHPTLEAVRDALNAHYEPELGERLVTAGLCLYRDGADSVAWHGDTIGRGRSTDTAVAILSLGSPREFLLRPRGGSAVARAIAGSELPVTRPVAEEPRPARTAAARPGARGGTPGAIAGRPRTVTGTGTIRHTLHHGDLIVMGGSCQRTWEHAVPKTTRPVGPRVSIQFRTRGVS
ncbi:alpha-ketoglutarate-dependent dioxygenase AlkB [Microlunatus flavus]|uniref:Alkylated DNA repair dioxygenase AlkB n=1 Tax=Microlunatus flavus TaxID=1036181 RepID=A0A1H9B558_9ACTN|nr:alpha-ketoglutarate-dependent dioxygenase AlkB [Microlunatus flavus]SEP84156.1 Alkylated DNA repair dioxygenase AlkB [Microlunatus flavus]